MPDNKNQSARWPSVTGGSVTGRINLQNYSPNAQRQALLANLRKQKFGGEMSLNDMLARQLQGVANSKIANEERLAITRQSNLQRMADLYGNYFQEFGGVLNERALAFLDHHSKINVPTLTAIMAGYEHARASAADRELMALQKQEQLLKEAQTVEQERVALANQRLDNNASVVQSNIAQAAKSYSDYMGGLISDAGGAIGGSGRGGGRTGGVGGRGGALGYDGGGANIAGGVRTGTSALSGQQSASASEGVADTKAEQTSVQSAQLGPLATQAREEAGGITQWGNGALGVTSALALPIFRGNSVLGAVGGALERAGSTTARGYFDESRLTNAQTQFSDAQNTLNRRKSLVTARERQYQQYLSRSGVSSSTIRDDIDFVKRGIRAGKSAGEMGISKREYNFAKRLVDAEDLRTAARESIKNAGREVSRLTNIQQEANSVGRFSRARTIGTLQRGAGKLLGKVLGPVALALEAYNWADEITGGLVAIGKWGTDRVLDYFGSSGRGLTLGQYYDEGRNSILAAQNQFFNTISGGRLNVGLEDADVQQTVGRLRELGWGGEGSEWDQNNFEINQLIQMKNQDPDSFYKALDALYQYDPQTHGNIAPFEYFQRAASQAAFDRTYAAQANKIAQDRQISEQQMAVEAEKANMIGNDTHPFLAAMMNHYTDMGRRAGYDFHEGHAVQFAKMLSQVVGDMESGNKRGAIGDMTSTGTAKGRLQMKDETFRTSAKWMLEEDERAGNRLLNSGERDILREASTKDANFLDNSNYSYLLDFMLLLYPLKSSVSASKFGKGNPDIRGDQMIVDMIQTFANSGNEMSPLLLNNIASWHSGAGWGRMGNKEYNSNINRYDAISQSKFGSDYKVSGVFVPDAQYAEISASQGLKYGNYGDPVLWRDQWARENFEIDKDGKIGNPKSDFKPYEQWKTDKGLEQAMSVGKPEQITMSQYIKKLNDKVDFDNLDPLVKRQLNAMAEEVGKYGRSVQLNSGRRDLAKNDELIRRWESGDRKGMVHKPSKNSKHLIGMAFDMQRSGPNGLDEIVNNIPELKQKYGDARGMMAAYGFDNNVKNDPVHFSLNEEFRRKNQKQGWSLPTIAARPFAVAEYPEPVIQQPVQNPWGVDFLGQYIPEVGQYQGSIQIGQEQPDFRTFTLDQQQGQQQQQQLEVVIGWDEDGNPVYQ